MDMPIIQLLVLAGIAIFLILRLRSVLGTRDGFERPPVSHSEDEDRRNSFEVIDGGPDHDIIDHAAEGSPMADALSAIKRTDNSFNVGEFLGGARGAYEMILMAFENGELDDVVPYLSPEVYEAFAEVVDEREKQGLKVEATFVGVSDTKLIAAEFDQASGEADITVRFSGEFTYVVRNAEGEIVEGSTSEIKRQRDTWTFSRKMGTDDPNWLLVATGE